jgi:hypothetical protein
MGPFPDVFDGVYHSMLDRMGYSPAYAIMVIMQQTSPSLFMRVLPAARDLFILYYLYLLIALIQKRIHLIEAGFLAYFGELLLGAAFRIWYPLWLIPFAALYFTPRNYWRTFLFSLTAELSILSYFILWRWKLERWEWAQSGPLARYWDYWLIMTPFTVSWTFGIPILGGMMAKRELPQIINETERENEA